MRRHIQKVRTFIYELGNKWDFAVSEFTDMYNNNLMFECNCLRTHKKWRVMISPGNDFMYTTRDLDRYLEGLEHQILMGLDLKTDIFTATMYQEQAARTINPKLDHQQMAMHALHEMTSEIGEIHSIYQKVYQGHLFDEQHVKSELGDLLWGVAEFCTAMHWDISDVMQANIEKLKKRYPDGFDVEHSLHRADGDI